MHDHDPIDFAMTDLPTRPGPCRKATAEEADATAAALAREVDAAPHIAEAAQRRIARAAERVVAARLQDEAEESNSSGRRLMEAKAALAVEVRYGSGKVKV
jgi:hypothetical protein